MSSWKSWYRSIVYITEVHLNYIGIIKTLLMLDTEYSGFGGNTMPADAMDPKFIRASADMVLAV